MPLSPLAQFLLCLVVTCGARCALCQNDALRDKWLHGYPRPEPGFVRYALMVKASTDAQVRVELVCGLKLVVSDGIEVEGGEITKEKYFAYYRVTPVTDYSSYALDQSERFVVTDSRFVAPTGLRGRPIVIYAPKEMEVRYRIWKLDPTAAEATMVSLRNPKDETPQVPDEMGVPSNAQVAPK